MGMVQPPWLAIFCRSGFRNMSSLSITRPLPFIILFQVNENNPFFCSIFIRYFLTKSLGVHFLCTFFLFFHGTTMVGLDHVQGSMADLCIFSVSLDKLFQYSGFKFWLRLFHTHCLIPLFGDVVLWSNGILSKLQC